MKKGLVTKEDFLEMLEGIAAETEIPIEYFLGHTSGVVFEKGMDIERLKQTVENLALREWSQDLKQENAELIALSRDLFAELECLHMAISDFKDVFARHQDIRSLRDRAHDLLRDPD